MASENAAGREVVFFFDHDVEGDGCHIQIVLLLVLFDKIDEVFVAIVQLLGHLFEQNVIHFSLRIRLGKKRPVARGRRLEGDERHIYIFVRKARARERAGAHPRAPHARGGRLCRLWPALETAAGEGQSRRAAAAGKKNASARLRQEGRASGGSWPDGQAREARDGAQPAPLARAAGGKKDVPPAGPGRTGRRATREMGAQPAPLARAALEPASRTARRLGAGAPLQGVFAPRPHAKPELDWSRKGGGWGRAGTEARGATRSRRRAERDAHSIYIYIIYIRMFSNPASYEFDVGRMFGSLKLDDQKINSAKTIRVNCKGLVRTLQIVFGNGDVAYFEGEMNKEILKKIESVNDKGEKVIRHYENGILVKAVYPDVVLVYSMTEKNKVLYAYEQKGVGLVPLFS